MRRGSWLYTVECGRVVLLALPFYYRYAINCAREANARPESGTPSGSAHYESVDERFLPLHSRHDEDRMAPVSRWAELRRLLTDVSQRHWLASWTKSSSTLCMGFTQANAARQFNRLVADALVCADATASARGGLWAHLSSSAR
jgi:hypothetical protein